MFCSLFLYITHLARNITCIIFMCALLLDKIRLLLTQYLWGIIYSPNIALKHTLALFPKAVFAMLASEYIGYVYSCVFLLFSWNYCLFIMLLTLCLYSVCCFVCCLFPSVTFAIVAIQAFAYATIFYILLLLVFIFLCVYVFFHSCLVVITASEWFVIIKIKQ